MTILKISYDNIREAISRIFDEWAENNADSFTVSALMNHDTRKVTWGVNLSSRGAQTTETMDETIKRLTLANNICKALNALDITVEWTENDMIHQLVEAGREERAYAINESYVETLTDILGHDVTVDGVLKAIIHGIDGSMRSNIK